ncbi:MAG: PspA/IM30 family protein [Desulfovibrio sp.]|nr:PspA/IM30 family protein [Desulfovibrio sp.]
MSMFQRVIKACQGTSQAALGTTLGAMPDSLGSLITDFEPTLRELRQDLQQAAHSLAEIRTLALRTRREANRATRRAAACEASAIQLLRRMQAGDLPPEDAEPLAAQALQDKEAEVSDALRLTQEAARLEQMAGRLQSNVETLQTSVRTVEAAVRTLRARRALARATARIDQRLAGLGSAGTMALLEQMQGREALGEALAQAGRDVEEEIAAALAGANPQVVQTLEDLKRRLGLLPAGAAP